MSIYTTDSVNSLACSLSPLFASFVEIEECYVSPCRIKADLLVSSSSRALLVSCADEMTLIFNGMSDESRSRRDRQNDAGAWKTQLNFLIQQREPKEGQMQKQLRYTGTSKRYAEFVGGLNQYFKGEPAAVHPQIRRTIFEVVLDFFAKILRMKQSLASRINSALNENQLVREVTAVPV